MTKRSPSKLTWYTPSPCADPTGIMKAVLDSTATLDIKLGAEPVAAGCRRVAVFDVITAWHAESPLPPPVGSLPTLDVLAIRQVRPVRVVRGEVTYVGDVIDHLINTTRELSSRKHVMSFADISRYQTTLRFGDSAPTKVLRIGVFAGQPGHTFGVASRDGARQNFYLDYAI